MLSTSTRFDTNQTCDFCDAKTNDNKKRHINISLFGRRLITSITPIQYIVYDI